MCGLSSNSWWSPSTKSLEITRHSPSTSMASNLFLMTSMSPNYRKTDGLKSSLNSFVILPICRTEVIIYLVERSPNGTSKRIPATTLFSYLEQANIKAQLTQIGVIMSATRTELSPAQLKQLLQTAPAGQHGDSCLCRFRSDFNKRSTQGAFCLCRSGSNHLGAGQSRQPWSWEVSRKTSCHQWTYLDVHNH